MKKAWWQSNTVQALIVQLAATWAVYFTANVSVKLCIGNSLLGVAAIFGRAKATKAISLKKSGD